MLHIGTVLFFYFCFSLCLWLYLHVCACIILSAFGWPFFKAFTHILRNSSDIYLYINFKDKTGNNPLFFLTNLMPKAVGNLSVYSEYVINNFLKSNLLIFMRKQIMCFGSSLWVSRMMNAGLQSRFMVMVSCGNDAFTFQEEIVYNNYFSLLFIIIPSIGVFGDDR